MRIHAITLTAVATSSLALLALSACDDRGAAPPPPPTKAPAPAAPTEEPDAPATSDSFDELGADVDLESAEVTLDGIRKELEAEEADDGGA